MVTDLHYADKDSDGNRYYRETRKKLSEATKQFEKETPDFVIALGDLIDAADLLDIEKGYLKRIHQDFTSIPCKHYYVLGNHCVWSLTKAEFLEIVGQKESYFSFDSAGYHFIVLDACYRKDGSSYGRKNFQWTDANIPAAESEWLRSDLQKNPHKSIVFIHQRLDVGGDYGVNNSTEIRRILEQSEKVIAVFQGHYHRNDYKQIADIHYCTLAAMVEGSGEEHNAYSLLEILPGDVIRVKGFCQQQGYDWK
jgi:predicted phosphodiesterase